MTEDKRKFSLFRKKEDEDQKAAAEAKAKAEELEEKKRAQARAAAREKTDAEIRARHEAQMEAAKAKQVKKHTVESGETLSGIAKKHYDDAGKYMKIYEANKEVIGGDPSLIQPGMELIIPEL